MDKIEINSDKSKLDIEFIYRFLTRSYWSPGISKEKVEKGINNSLCFGIYKNNCQIGFARVITDYSRIAYLTDVFIIESEKGKGYGKLLLKHIFDSGNIEVDKWLLGTKDAHALYAKFGFSNLKEPWRIMEKRNQ
ncbi:MAG: GNAT family N-acetyltransferase [Bacteroidia bacterium]